MGVGVDSDQISSVDTLGVYRWKQVLLAERRVELVLVDASDGRRLGIVVAVLIWSLKSYHRYTVFDDPS